MSCILIPHIRFFCPPRRGIAKPSVHQAHQSNCAWNNLNLIQSTTFPLSSFEAVVEALPPLISMADPFEVRMRFTNLLSHLSASTTASTKTAAYALKHRDLDEDLHSCILENLERNNMNNRANIMYFLEPFCEMATREKHEAYVEMVRRDLVRIVEAVAQNGANLKVCRKVVGDLAGKGVLGGNLLETVEEQLKEKERDTGKLLKDEMGDEHDPHHGDDTNGMDAPLGEDQGDNRPVQAALQRVTLKTPTGAKRSLSSQKVDKQVIMQRIEEDRERNKRLRESVWAVSEDENDELHKLWEEGSDLGDDDFVITVEEAEERKQFARYYSEQLKV